MDIDMLEEFVTVYETLSFQETADRLNLSQSALTKHIHKLEEELGVSLFDRSTRSVKPNEYSEAYYPYAEQIVRTAKEGAAALKAIANGDEYRLQLAFTSTCSQYGIIELISGFAKQNPQYHTRITESFRVCDMILGKQCDFAFINDAIPIDDRLDRVIYKVDHLAAYMRPDHPLAKRDSISITDLQEEDIIAHSRANGSYHHDTLRFKAACKAAGFEPELRVSASYTSVILKLVKERQGVAVLFQGQIPQDQMDPGIRAVPIAPAIESTVYMLYDHRAPRTQARRAFLHYLLDLTEKNGHGS